MRGRSLAWLCLPLVILAAGCGRSRPIEAWFVDSLVQVFPDDALRKNQLREPVFAAARGAHVSLQLALGSELGIGDLFVDALPLTGPGMPIERIQVRRVEYVVVTTNTPGVHPAQLVRKAPALFPDALWSNFPMTAEKNKARSVWITIPVPPAQTPGRYRGELRVRRGLEEILLMPYTLEVTAAAIPGGVPLAVSLDFDFSDAHMQQFYRCSKSSEECRQVASNIARFLAGYYQTSAPSTRDFKTLFIDCPLLSVRIEQWMNFRTGFRGVLGWSGNHWGPEPMKDTQPVSRTGRTLLAPGAAYLTYPDRERRSVLSSVRLEQMREGIQDYALLWELNKRDPEKARELAYKMVASATGPVREPATFRAIQRELLAAF